MAKIDNLFMTKTAEKPYPEHGNYYKEVHARNNRYNDVLWKFYNKEYDISLSTDCWHFLNFICFVFSPNPAVFMQSSLGGRFFVREVVAYESLDDIGSKFCLISIR